METIKNYFFVDMGVMLGRSMRHIFRSMDTIISRTDTSFNKSSQLDYAIPQAKIAGLSSGEFVGMVADNPDEKIQLKVFHCSIKPEFMSAYSCDRSIPAVNDSRDEEVYQNYLTVKREISEMVSREIESLLTKVK